MGMTRARPSTSETLEGTARHPNHGRGQKIRLAERGLATIREAAATELKGKYEEGQPSRSSPRPTPSSSARSTASSRSSCRQKAEPRSQAKSLSCKGWLASPFWGNLGARTGSGKVVAGYAVPGGFCFSLPRPVLPNDLSRFPKARTATVDLTSDPGKRLTCGQPEPYSQRFALQSVRLSGTRRAAWCAAERLKRSRTESCGARRRAQSTHRL